MSDRTRWLSQYRNRWFCRRNILLALLAFQLVCLLGWTQAFWMQREGIVLKGNNDITLAFIIPESEREPWERVSSAFEEKNPGIHIELVRPPTTIDTPDERAFSYSKDFEREEAKHDLVYMDITWIAEFAEHLKDLSTFDVSSDAIKEGFLESEIEAGEINGKLYRMPMRADIGVLFYRRDFLEEINRKNFLEKLRMGLPVTVLELKDVVQEFKNWKASDPKTKNMNLSGYLWQGSSEEELVTNFVEVLHTVGGSWINQNNKPMLNSKKTKKAVKLLWALIHEYQISPLSVSDYTETEALDEFVNGNAIFLRGWPAFYNRIIEKGLGEKVEISLPFSFEDEESLGNKKTGKGCRGGWGFGIPKNATHPEEAWKAIQYFTSAEAQKEFISESGYLPTRDALFKDKKANEKYPKMSQIYSYLKASIEDQKDASVFRPSLKQYTEASDILQKTISKILQENSSDIDIDQTIDEAMEAAQQETSDLKEFIEKA